MSLTTTEGARDRRALRHRVGRRPCRGPTSTCTSRTSPRPGTDEFDAWAATYEHPFADLLEATAYRNWDSDRRLEEMDADGVVAEVLFPNSVPPFFEESNLVATPPTDDDYERRWGRAPGPQPLE